MKRLFLIMLLVFPAAFFAQDNFIEVEVSDTITLEPERIEYIITINKLGEKDSSNKKSVSKARKLANILEKEKYKFRLEQTHLIDKIIIEVREETELLRINELVGNEDYVSRSIGDITYANEQKSEEDLYKKLLAKARDKASIIALETGMGVGHIIATREPTDIGGLEFNIHDTYYVSGKSRTWSFTEKKLSGSLFKKLIVKFASE